MTAAAPAHGGLVHDELRALALDEDRILDFSVNVNPYGPCPEIRSAISGARIDRYPDPSATRARLRVAEWLGVSAETVLIANGATDVFWTLARAALRDGDTALVAEPAFSEMRTAAAHAGARIVECRSDAHTDFAFDEARFTVALRAERPRLAYVATPANPSGTLVPGPALCRLAAENPTTLVVADVSFASLSSRPEDGRASSEGVLWVHSLTKELSVPGVRAGFAVGPAAWIDRLHRARPPWSVNAVAEAVTVTAPAPAVRAFVEASRARLLGERAYLEAGLRALDLRVHPSETTYVLVDLGPRRTGAGLRRALLERHGVLVRDAASFGLPHHVRIAARSPADVDRLLGAIKKELTA